MNNEDPIRLIELATLPREQIGPFLLLGLDKDASAEQVEAHWAQRVIWARRHQVPVSLPEINWAREMIRDPVQRLRAEAATLNPDTTPRALRALAERYGVGYPGGPTWQPREEKADRADEVPRLAVPDPAAIRATIVIPAVPLDAASVARLLENFLRPPLDPWAPDLPGSPSDSLDQELPHE